MDITKFAGLAIAAAAILHSPITPLGVADAAQLKQNRHGQQARVRVNPKMPTGAFQVAPDQNRNNEPGYPTPGQAFQACGGADNVFVVYEETPYGNTGHRYDCVD